MKVKGLAIANIRKIEYSTIASDRFIGGIVAATPIIKTSRHKDNALLIKVSDNGYVDVDTINNVWDSIKIKQHVKKNKTVLGNIVLADFVPPIGNTCDLYVEPTSIKECDLPEGYENKPIWSLCKKLKKDHKKRVI